MKIPENSRLRAASEESSLCQFPYADGRRCRMLRHASHPALCLVHAREEQQLLQLDQIAAELASLSGDFKTATDINHVLGKLFKLVAANRIPIRNARLLSGLAHLLLSSLKGVRHEMTSTQGFRAWEKTVREAYSARALSSPLSSPSGSPPALPQVQQEVQNVP